MILPACPAWRTIAVVAPQFSGPFSQGIRYAIEARRSNFTVRAHFHAVSDDPDRQTTRIRALLTSRAEPPPAGLICVSIRPPVDLIAEFRQRGIPVVLIDEDAFGAASVSADNRHGGDLAAQHLLDLGHRRIALITGRTFRPGSANADARKAGAQAAFARNDRRLLIVDQHEVADYSKADGRDWFTIRPPDATAVICAAGDLCASGILQAAHEAGWSIPQDLSIVGYDDSPAAEILELTTIRQPIRELADTAYRLVVLEPDRTLTKPHRIVLPPSLIVRRTTARCREADMLASARRAAHG